MNLQQVIEAGRINVDTSIFSESIWWWIVIGGLLLLSMLFYKWEVDGTGFIGLAVIVFILLCIVNEGNDEEKKQQLIEQWKQQYAYPYINSLPTQKKEIVYIKIDPELGYDVQSNEWYTYSVPVKLTPLTISFKGNGIETYTNWYESHMELTKEQKPYAEYKKLDVDLGNGVNAGMYNTKVYLPESYSFTDIK